MSVLTKDQLEASLNEEKKLIETGRLKDDNPLDSSPSFIKLCESSRQGDLKSCQEAITEGANINARDEFDYTPLILASLCGHYEVVELLLESGALCERDTFQGERCLYNALNDRIRNLLLSYDFSKSADPLQPLASHITSLFSRDHPKTSDIVVTSSDQAFALHKFVLAARSPYFRHKLASAPDTKSFKVPSKFPPQSFEAAIKYVYLGDLPLDLGGPGTGFTEQEVLEGLERMSRLLEIPSLWGFILEMNDRRLARQHRSEETELARAQLEQWFKDSVLRYKIEIDSTQAGNVKWDRDNEIFADVLLRADQALEHPENDDSEAILKNRDVPVGPLSTMFEEKSGQKSVLYPAHKAMLLRSEFFRAMFSSSFLEAQDAPYLHIVPIECSPEVLEAILRYIYTERAEFSLEVAVDVLFVADLLLMERLKNKTALIISTLGNGNISHTSSADGGLMNEESTGTPPEENPSDPLDPFHILRAAWLLRVPRLETFAARYLAYRLEKYIDLPDFADAIRESAARIKQRQETDSIELIDDIRYYLDERFRLRFEGDGIEELLQEQEHGQENGQEQEQEHLQVEETREIAGRESKVLENKFAGSSATWSSLKAVGEIRTLDGDIVGDEFASDAINYHLLMNKIESLLDRLELDG